MLMRRQRLACVSALALCAVGATTAATASDSAPSPATQFRLFRSAATAQARCIPGANAFVQVSNVRSVQVMKLSAARLPANTTFVVWVNQVPNAPFGVSGYLGDVTTGANGRLSETFVGRFNVETFAVAPGTAPAPVTHPDGPFPDANANPAFAPVHTYHLGLWFDSPEDAAKAGCPNATTPFNGDHTAGVQALSTRNFPDDRGPLQRAAVPD